FGAFFLTVTVRRHLPVVVAGGATVCGVGAGARGRHFSALSLSRRGARACPRGAGCANDPALPNRRSVPAIGEREHIGPGGGVPLSPRGGAGQRPERGGKLQRRGERFAFSEHHGKPANESVPSAGGVRGCDRV